MFDNPKDAVIQDLRAIISDLREENKTLRKSLEKAEEKAMALLDIEAFKAYKMFNQEKNKKPLERMIYDAETKGMRKVTKEDMARDWAGMQELGIT